MKKIGLTGNIGSGKTTITKIFTILGIPIYNADIEAKKFLNNNEISYKLIEKFGNKIISNNQIDRIKLSKIVFSKKESLSFLNSLIHPLVKEDFDNWCNIQSENNYILLEAAILFESKFNIFVDKTVLVSAPQNISIERVILRDNILKEDVLKRMKNQWNEEMKIPLCDYIIMNDNKQLLIPQVIEIHNKIFNL